MAIDTARAFFETVAARGRDERLKDAVGAWEFDIEGAGSWTIAVDHGVLRVSGGKPTAQSQPSPKEAQPNVRLHLSEAELLRLAHAEGHENLLTALLRGALDFEGELAFGQKLQAILPLPEDWRTGS